VHTQVRGHPAASSDTVPVIVSRTFFIVSEVILTGIKFPVHKPYSGDKDERDSSRKGKAVVAFESRSVLDQHRGQKEHSTGNGAQTCGFYQPDIVLVRPQKQAKSRQRQGEAPQAAR